jgi:hypothetical protein
MMPKDPTIAIRDCLAEIAILHRDRGALDVAGLPQRPDRPPRSCVRASDHLGAGSPHERSDMRVLKV